MKENDDARVVYADIIDHPHYRSAVRLPMPPLERAAQFSPFDALVGFSDRIDEEARFTEREVSPDEHEIERIDRKLALLAAETAAGRRPRVCLTVFVPDARKAGGSYQRVVDTLWQVDAAAQRLVLASKDARSGLRRSVAFASITEIRSEATDKLE